MKTVDRVSFGPRARLQTNWDWRVAGNFICGGAGSGFIALALVLGAEAMRSKLMLAGLALVGVGLLCVWMEIGQPMRAFNVFRGLGHSWMSREAMVATLLFASGLAMFIVDARFAWPMALFALAFLYCQGRMISAARGIPSWREQMVVPLIVVTGITEGCGLLALAGPGLARSTATVAIVLAGLVVVRYAVWEVYRRRATGAGNAAAALRRAGNAVLWLGTALPLLLVVAALSLSINVALLLFIAGLAALLAGGYLKFALITRAGYTLGIIRPGGSRESLFPSEAADEMLAMVVVRQAEARRTKTKRQPVTQY